MVFLWMHMIFYYMFTRLTTIGLSCSRLTNDICSYTDFIQEPLIPRNEIADQRPVLFIEGLVHTSHCDVDIILHVCMIVPWLLSRTQIPAFFECSVYMHGSLRVWNPCRSVLLPNLYLWFKLILVKFMLPFWLQEFIS